MAHPSQSFSRKLADFNPQRPVTAAWSLDYLPVNVSVVFGQDKRIIGSRSWMFETFVTALTEISHAFPWSVGVHCVMWAKHDPDTFKVFHDAGIYPRVALTPSDALITQITSALLESATIDLEIREFEPEGNNLLLIEALNGFAARETNLNTWSLNGVTEYHYLTRAFETYAVWLDQNKSTQEWGKAMDYTKHDRSVI